MLGYTVRVKSNFRITHNRNKVNVNPCAKNSDIVELFAPTRIRTFAFVSEASGAGRSETNNTRTHRPILSIFQSQTTFRNFLQMTADKYLDFGSIYEVEYFNLPQQANPLIFYASQAERNGQ